VSRRCCQGLGAVVAAAMAVTSTGACGSDDRPKPSLRRPAAAVWCPSTILTLYARKPGDARHGTWDARAIIGLNLDDARRLAARHGCQIRVVGGEDADPDTLITMDLRFDRVNVEVTGGVVTALDGGASSEMVG
jgi:hypothetical protein